MKKSIQQLCAVLVGLLALVACAPVHSQPALEVSDAWARATPPGASAGAAYLTLHNRSKSPVSLISLESEAAKAVEIHEMSLRDGQMRMRSLEGEQIIAPGTSLSLKPGGLHLMLMGLKAPLRAGTSLELSLKLGGGQSQKLSLPVLESAP